LIMGCKANSFSSLFPISAALFVFFYVASLLRIVPSCHFSFLASILSIS